MRANRSIRVPRLTVATIMFIALTGSVACRASAEEPEGIAVTLVPAEEIAKMEAELMASVKANQERKCLRPLPPGVKANPGNADQDIIEVMSGKQFEECFALLKDKDDAVRTWLDSDDRVESADLAATREECAGLVAAVAKAIAHEDACSPYLAGRRGAPLYINLIRVAKAYSALMWETANQDPGKAVRQGLEFLLFAQDTTRGDGAPLIGAMIAVAIQPFVIEKGLTRILANHGAKISAAQLQELADGLGTLLKQEPHFHSFLLYERDGLVLQTLLPGMKEKGWVPPGGFDEDYHPYEEASAEGKELPNLAQGQEQALGWVAHSTAIGRLLAACSKQGSAVDCAVGMERAAKEMAAEADGGHCTKLIKLAFFAEPTKQLRDWILEILRAVASPAFIKYVGRFATRSFQIRGLQLHALALKHLAASGKCPTAEELTGTEWKLYNRDPASNLPLKISSPDKGKYLIQPPKAFPKDAAGQYDESRYEFSCGS